MNLFESKQSNLLFDRIFFPSSFFSILYFPWSFSTYRHSHTLYIHVIVAWAAHLSWNLDCRRIYYFVLECRTWFIYPTVCAAQLFSFLFLPQCQLTFLASAMITGIAHELFQTNSFQIVSQCHIWGSKIYLSSKKILPSIEILLLTKKFEVQDSNKSSRRKWVKKIVFFRKFNFFFETTRNAKLQKSYAYN